MLLNSVTRFRAGCFCNHLTGQFAVEKNRRIIVVPRLLNSILYGGWFSLVVGINKMTMAKMKREPLPYYTIILLPGY